MIFSQKKYGMKNLHLKSREDQELGEKNEHVEEIIP